jgi:hypothetical protein
MNELLTRENFIISVERIYNQRLESTMYRVPERLYGPLIIADMGLYDSGAYDSGAWIPDMSPEDYILDGSEDTEDIIDDIRESQDDEVSGLEEMRAAQTSGASFTTFPRFIEQPYWGEIKITMRFDSRVRNLTESVPEMDIPEYAI